MEGSICVRCNEVSVKDNHSCCPDCKDSLAKEYNLAKIEPFKESKSVKHLKILDEIHMLYEAKNGDYGDSFSKLYKEYGNLSSVVRLSDKLERFKTLTNGNEARVKSESIRDTLIDMCGYAIMTIMEMDNE